MLFLLATIAGYGDASTPGTLERGIGSKDAAQDSRLVGGTQRLSLLMAQALGSNVVLNAPVRVDRAERRRRRDASRSHDGRAWRGARAVVAIPPPLAVEIDWDPLLPAEHDALRRRMVLGTLAKCEAIYDDAVLAQGGLQRPGDQARRLRGPGDLRQHAARRRAGRVDGVHGRQVVVDLPDGVGRGPQAGGAQRLRERVRVEGAVAGRLLRAGLGRGALDARRADGGPGAGDADALRAEADRAGRRRALGGHRDRGLLERLHGRRDLVGRARGQGGAGEV